MLVLSLYNLGPHIYELRKLEALVSGELANQMIEEFKNAIEAGARFRWIWMQKEDNETKDTQQEYSLIFEEKESQ